MRKFWLCALLCVFTALAASCAPSTPPIPAKSGTIRVGFPSEADVGDVPTLMAMDALAKEGYTVQPVFFSGADLEVAALQKGDLDFGNGSTRTHWSAISKGLPVVTIMEEVADDWFLMGNKTIQSCKDLEGKRVAYTNAGSTSAELFNIYMQDCPTVQPTILTIANSQDRAAALMAGQIDATPVELGDLLQINQQAPGKFNTLASFQEKIPQLMTTGTYVRSDFAKQHPEIVNDYVEAVLTANRNNQTNPQALQDAIASKLKVDAATAQQLGAAFLKNHQWNVNGGLTNDSVTYSLDFLVKNKAIPAGLTAEKISDLSFLNAALDKLGRK